MVNLKLLWIYFIIIMDPKQLVNSKKHQFLSKMSLINPYDKLIINN